eukprot:jgi/Hompol1/4569/HPOL_003710-RA
MFAVRTVRTHAAALKSKLPRSLVQQLRSKHFDAAPVTAASHEISNPKGPAPTLITQLPNGIRIATQESLGHFVGAGIYVDSGSKYETPETAGCSHLLDRMAFKSTKQLSTEQLVQQLEKLGGNVTAHSSREGMMYQASVFRHDLSKMMSIFGQIIRDPLFLENELAETREGTRYELRELSSRMDMVLSEVVHAVAFQADTHLNETTPVVQKVDEADFSRTNTLGNSLMVGERALGTINSKTIRDFHSTWYTPDRIVVAGIGMDHARLVDLAEREFSAMAPASEAIKSIQAKCTVAPRYTGGIRVLDTAHMPPSPNPDDIPLTHIHIAFESVSMTDPDIYALATLTSLMGGGGSFSAGGPGKGMYTRLYTQVLNRNAWVDSCHMVNYTYGETGLLSIQAAVFPSVHTHRQIVAVLAEQLVGMTRNIQESELSRAKNQLKSNLLMSLESKLVELEDVGRQIQAYSRRLDVLEMCRRIDMLTTEDIVRVARRVIFGEEIRSPLDFGDKLAKHWVRSGNGAPTVVVHGPLDRADPLADVGSLLARWGIGAGDAVTAAALAESARNGGR